MKKIIYALVALCIFVACNNASEKKSEVGITPADSLLNKVESKPVFSLIKDSSLLKVLRLKGESLSYPEYKNLFEAESEFNQPSFKREDIDKDGNDEIVVYHYTGGAHCCDVNTILTRSGENEMKEVLDYTGGIYISKDTVVLSFYEALGYFHTCYACNIEYPKNIAPVATFTYKDGKFSFAAFSQQLEDDIHTNLKAITAKPIPDKDADEAAGFDDGTRKAIAFNIVTFYFNKQDLAATKAIFDQYYNHKDKAIIWTNIDESITAFNQGIKKGVLQ